MKFTIRNEEWSIKKFDNLGSTKERATRREKIIAVFESRHKYPLYKILSFFNLAKSTYFYTIKTFDRVGTDKPVINGTKLYTRSYNNPISIEDIKVGLSICDNYDNGLQLQLIQDNYSSYANKVGIHTVTFKAVDISNNESDVFTVSITVEAKDKPVISGSTSISVPSNKIQRKLLLVFD